jgi:hypothetical protein
VFRIAAVPYLMPAWIPESKRESCGQLLPTLLLTRRPPMGKLKLLGPPT